VCCVIFYENKLLWNSTSPVFCNDKEIIRPKCIGKFIWTGINSSIQSGCWSGLTESMIVFVDWPGWSGYGFWDFRNITVPAIYPGDFPTAVQSTKPTCLLFPSKKAPIPFLFCSWHIRDCGKSSEGQFLWTLKITHRSTWEYLPLHPIFLRCADWLKPHLVQLTNPDHICYMTTRSPENSLRNTPWNSGSWKMTSFRLHILDIRSGFPAT